jgi:DNA-directed RNA polymerase sigma subunit (sigma70/sigma32)
MTGLLSDLDPVREMVLTMKILTDHSQGLAISRIAQKYGINPQKVKYLLEKGLAYERRESRRDP